MSLTVLLVKGVLLGVSAAAPIGPVNVEIARRTLRFGRGAGFLLGCGAVTVDVGYAVVTSLSFARVLREPARWVTTGLSVGAAIFLGYLAYLCFRSAAGGGGERREVFFDGAAGGEGRGMAGHYLTGLVMTALNPMTLGFWFIVVPGAVAGQTGRAAQELPMVCVGVFLGALGWVCFFTWLIGHLQRFGGGQRWVRWVDLAGGMMLLAFAMRAIWRVAGATL